MPQIGLPELLLVLVIVVLVFGVGRLSEVGSALGKSIREFRNATQGKDIDADKKASSEEKGEQDKSQS
jgi:sec-independent protein translocase protein TatA